MSLRTPRQEFTQIRRRADSNALMGCLPPWLAFCAGDQWHVKPFSGSDFQNDGRSPDKPFKTLARALACAHANQNDVIFMHGEGNASAYCTDYQNGLLTWNKDMVHLIGVNSGGFASPRNRIAFQSAYNTATDLFSLTANGCYFQGIQFWEGVAHALPTGCMTVSGRLNHFSRCHIVGIGDATNDIASAYSLNMYGAIQNLFEDCVIGTYTTNQGAVTSNSQILYTTTGNAATCSAGNIFKGCKVWMHATHITNHIFLVVPTVGIGSGGVELFEDCMFINPGTALTNAFSISTTAGGFVVLGGKTIIVGAGHTIASATSSVLYGPQAYNYSVATAALAQALGG